jgi:hypothetical protein
MVLERQWFKETTVVPRNLIVPIKIFTFQQIVTTVGECDVRFLKSGRKLGKYF